MDFKQFLSSYRGLRSENWFYRVLCGALLLSNLILGVAVFSSKETVVLVPPVLREPVQVGLKQADRKHQESWALFFALLLDNITPRNLEFVAGEIEKYLSPAIYQSVMQDVVEQARGVREANISTTFEPRELVYDGKV
jgi:conjugal transfer pilus assembly protein TraE